VFDLISWKRSLRGLNEEYEMARRKKQALENLMSVGKISQSTYEAFNRDIEEAIAEIEKQQRALQDKMSVKADELEGQIRTLEMLLANFEIQHVAGEVDDETYQRQADLLSAGLDNSRKELELVREAMDQLASGSLAVPDKVEIELPAEETVKTEAGVVEIPISTVEQKASDPPIEPVKASEETSQQTESETEAAEENEN
jgi:hypothetical protein